MAEQKTAKHLTPVEYLAQISPDAAQSFQSLRKAVGSAGPLDANTCELIALGAFATTGAEGSFKTHARRLLKEGMSADALRQAVLVTFAATTTFSSVIAALHWVDDLVDDG